jgi:hypothetical protein
LPDPPSNDVAYPLTIAEGLEIEEEEDNDHIPLASDGRALPPLDTHTHICSVVTHSSSAPHHHHPRHRQRSMAAHICDVIKQVRGRRPKPSSSFAMIGVDSLGAVMFIKSLSDSLGGVRIEPSKLYAPGVTITSFAEELYQRLLTENPDALEKVGCNQLPGKNLFFPRSTVKYVVMHFFYHSLVRFHFSV